MTDTMETNFGTATPRQRYALFCITKKDYRKVELSKEEASKMIADLQTEQKEKGSEKARKQTVKTAEIFMDKDQMREEFLPIWGKDSKMVEWSVKNHSGFKLSDGKAIMLDKPHIETNFCFGYSTCGQGPEMSECFKTHDNFKKNKESWFILENIQRFEREFRYPEPDYLLVLSKYYDRGNIWGYNWVSEGRLEEFIDRVAFGREYVVCRNENDIDLIKRAITAHKQTFVKRLERYVKRYGTSKLKSWTYWIDE